jgi:outer membrane receptor protein involved in Fe transport
VNAGDRLPLTPRHVAKAGVDVAVVRGLTLGTSATYTGAQFFRGDEGNLLDELDGYTVFDVRARYAVYRGFEVFGVVTNVFDTEYATAGLFGEPDEVAGFDDFENPRFLTPGAPRFIRLGVGYTF